MTSELAAPGYLTLPELRQPLDLAELFGRNAPVELEIGAGRGDFMIQYAAANPGINFLAIERKLVILRRAGIKLIRAGLTNSRIINGDIVYLLRNYIPSQSLRAVHIYFPDPWPKKRHEKRRIFRDEILDLIHRSLTKPGFLHIRTDVQSYFDTMLEIMARRPEFTRIAPPEELLGHLTGFETRFIQDEKPIYRVSFRL